MFLKFHVFFVCHFVLFLFLTIWHKGNKLTIYLSIYKEVMDFKTFVSMKLALMALNSSWIISCVKKTYIPVDWYQRLILSKALTNWSNQVNHQQNFCDNESKTLTTAPRPCLVSRKAWASFFLFFFFFCHGKFNDEITLIRFYLDMLIISGPKCRFLVWQFL